jgi:hypothetical protein
MPRVQVKAGAGQGRTDKAELTSQPLYRFVRAKTAVLKILSLSYPSYSLIKPSVVRSLMQTC